MGLSFGEGTFVCHTHGHHKFAIMTPKLDGELRSAGSKESIRGIVKVPGLAVGHHREIRMLAGCDASAMVAATARWLAFSTEAQLRQMPHQGSGADAGRRVDQ